MSRHLIRYLQHDPLDQRCQCNRCSQRKLSRILIETGAAAPRRLNLELADPQDLRGIPCIARGVGGTSPGTNPLTEALRNV